MSVVTYYHVRFGVIDDDGNISVLYCQNKAEDILVSNSGNRTYVPDVSTLEALIDKFNRWTFRDTDIGYSDVSSFVYNGIDCNVGGKILDARALKTAVELLSSSISDVSNRLTNHMNNKNNPHGVTKAQVGLGNCDNTADSVKRVAWANEANRANGVYDCFTEDGQGAHSFMFNWDGSCAWMYVDSGSNWIKLGPCGNDLSAKQDVNQYKTVRVVGSVQGTDNGSGNTNQIQTLTFTTNYSEAGWKMIALCGYSISDGTANVVNIDVSSQTITVTVTFNPSGNKKVDINVWITCAPVS